MFNILYGQNYELEHEPDGRLSTRSGHAGFDKSVRCLAGPSWRSITRWIAADGDRHSRAFGCTAAAPSLVVAPSRCESARTSTSAAAGCTKRNLRDAANQFAALIEAPNPSRRWQATAGEERRETQVLYMTESDGAFLQPDIQVGACGDSPASAPALLPQRMRRLRVQYSKDLADTGTPIPGIRTQPTQAEMEGPIEDFLERVGDEAALKEVVQLLLKTEDAKGPRFYICAPAQPRRRRGQTRVGVFAVVVNGGSIFVHGVSGEEICKKFCEAVVAFETGDHRSSPPRSRAPRRKALACGAEFPTRKVAIFVTDAEANFKLAQTLIVEWFHTNQNGRVVVVLVPRRPPAHRPCWAYRGCSCRSTHCTSSSDSATNRRARCLLRKVLRRR